MNTDEMPAGKEMNEAVALALGYTFIDFPEGACPHVKHWSYPDGRFCGMAPQFSESMGKAWEVVEHMTATTKESWEFHHTTTMQTAIFEFDGGRDRPWKPGQYVGDALSMPLAICRAALKAVAK